MLDITLEIIQEFITRTNARVPNEPLELTDIQKQALKNAINAWLRGWDV